MLCLVSVKAMVARNFLFCIFALTIIENGINVVWWCKAGVYAERGNNHGINYDIVYMRYTRASLGLYSGKTRRRRDKIEEVLY